MNRIRLPLPTLAKNFLTQTELPHLHECCRKLCGGDKLSFLFYFVHCKLNYLSPLLSASTDQIERGTTPRFLTSFYSSLYYNRKVWLRIFSVRATVTPGHYSLPAISDRHLIHAKRKSTCNTLKERKGPQIINFLITRAQPPSATKSLHSATDELPNEPCSTWTADFGMAPLELGRALFCNFRPLLVTDHLLIAGNHSDSNNLDWDWTVLQAWQPPGPIPLSLPSSPVSSGTSTAPTPSIPRGRARSSWRLTSLRPRSSLPDQCLEIISIDMSCGTKRIHSAISRGGTKKVKHLCLDLAPANSKK